MSRSDRPAMPWSESLDAATRLAARLRAAPADDPEARRLVTELLVSAVESFAALLDADGRVIDVTSAPLRQAGLDRADIVGGELWRSPIWQTFADAAAVREAVEKARGGRRARAVVALASADMARVFRTRLQVRPLRSRDGRIAFLLAQAPVQAAPASVEPAGDVRLALQLARLLELRQRLVADVVHDIRVPLNSTVAHAERLLASERSAIRQEGREIRAAALAALTQLSELSDLTRLEHRRTRLTLADCDVVACLHEVATQFEPVATADGRTLVVQAPGELTARVDAQKLTKILANLVGNAIRYARPGGRVRCSLDADEEWIVIEVADDGPGIPAAERAAVFTRRWRSPGQADRTPGSGLGLAIVRESVQLHGGTIEVGDAPEGGALFTVRLPFLAPSGRPKPGTLGERMSRTLTTQSVVADVERRIPPRRSRR